MPRPATYILAIPTAVIIAVLAFCAQEPRAVGAAGKKPGNLDYWLSQATTSPASRPADKTPASRAKTLSTGNRPTREDAVPGVIEMSDGTQWPGWLYTTRDKPWIVFDPAADRWRRIPFIAVLSINAVVTEEKYMLQWRWKGMGEPEKVFTGKKFPYRRFLWEFRLIDGSTIRGAVKGQPVWVAWGGRTTGPLVLHERDKGKIDTKLEDVKYVRKIVVSTKMRDAVLEDQAPRKDAPAKTTR